MSLCAVIALTACVRVALATVPADTTPSLAQPPIDSAITQLASVTLPQADSSMPASVDPDSQQAQAADEEDFQKSLDSLFTDPFAAIDSFSLDSNHINSGRFNSAEWNDTARVVLQDSLTGKRYVHPAPGHITSNFGQRRFLWHYGVDTKLYKGDTVRVAFDGIVRVLQYDRRGYGNVVVVRHAAGLETIYGHLSKKLVMVGDTLKAGDVVGLGGNTGRSTGSHLHFEMRYRGEPINPNMIVDFENSSLKGDTLVITKAAFEYLVELRKMKWCTIRSGDTLGHIAMRYHSTVTKLCQLNGISRKSLLRVGRKIRYQ